MVLCKWCGDENVVAVSPLVAELKNNTVRIYRTYHCSICKLEFDMEDEFATREYERTTGRTCTNG
jgi:hypothetical protein